jgi:hypothetical protein
MSKGIAREREIRKREKNQNKNKTEGTKKPVTKIIVMVKHCAMLLQQNKVKKIMVCELSSAMLIFYLLFMTTVVLQWQSRIAVTEMVWLIRLKLFTI